MMSSSRMTGHTGQTGVTGRGAKCPTDTQRLGLGRLAFRVGFCPLYRRYSGHALAALFISAINNDTARFFEDENGATAAALILARLSEEVSEQMLIDRIPPSPVEWAAENKLWFRDLIAPFGHGKQIGRDPPAEPFFWPAWNGRALAQGGCRRCDAAAGPGLRLSD